MVFDRVHGVDYLRWDDQEWIREKCKVPFPVQFDKKKVKAEVDKVCFLKQKQPKNLSLLLKFFNFFVFLPICICSLALGNEGQGFRCIEDERARRVVWSERLWNQQEESVFVESQGFVVFCFSAEQFRRTLFFVLLSLILPLYDRLLMVYWMAWLDLVQVARRMPVWFTMALRFRLIFYWFFCFCFG